MGIFVRCLTWSIVVLVTAVVLDRAGPTKGWLRNPQTGPKRDQTPTEPAPGTEGAAVPELHSPPVNKPVPPTQTRPAGTGSPADTAGGDGPHTSIEPTTTPKPALAPIEKTEYERLYETLVERHLKALPPPKVGRGYRIRLQGGRTVEGTLEEIAPARIKLGMKYGKITLPVHRVIRADLARLFPEREAKMRALEDVRKTIAARRELEIASATVRQPVRTELPDPGPQDHARPTGGLPPAPGGPEDEGAVLAYRTPPRTAGPVRFNPDPPQSTPDLKPIVVDFARWLEVQHRRMGGKVADRVFARRQDGAAVLYMVVNPSFLAQDYDLRFQLAESLWQFWAFRCDAKKAVSSLEDAFVVLLDARGRYIGGSRPTRGSDLWAKDTKSLASAR